MGQQKTIKLLIVDDEEDLYFLVMALQDVVGTRYIVNTATSSLAALNCLAKNNFDAIICDYRLGPVTGIDFITHVRKAGIDTPIILLTDVADTIIDNAALKAGASDFVTKTSVSPDLLDRSVRYAIAHAERHRLFQTVLKSTKSGIAVLDERGSLSLWNPRFVDFAQTGFGERSDRMAELVKLTLHAGDDDITVGDLIVEAHTTQLPDGSQVLALHDVTARVRQLKEREIAEAKIRKIALQDVLTGLPNRMAFNEYMDRCLLEAAKECSQVALLSFDFNRFKEVNDLLGHAAGDQLLRSVAQRLASTLTDGEYAARLGGDEFVLVQRHATMESATALANKVATILSCPVDWEMRVIEASVSVGVALYPTHGLCRQELLANADLAMYRGKAETTMPVCLFDAGMDQFVRERRKMTHDLKRAVQEKELKLLFQPQFNAKTGSLFGFEALLRWQAATRGVVSPGDFIPLAEETGMICEIDNWVLQEACEVAASIHSLNRIAVNISAKAICQPGIVTFIRDVLLRTGLAPTRLELEVTETALIHDLNRALHNLRLIKALGILIAMDDFGTGYSSLSLLNLFPFDRIKIDKSFIQQAGNNCRTDAIFRSVISLGNVLNIPVLVEGVETPEQYKFAIEAGCNEIQGYFIGHPLLLSDMRELLKTQGALLTATDFEQRYENKQQAQSFSERIYRRDELLLSAS